VWQVAWAHPKFGAVLASCSYDRKVIVWKEEQPGQWRKIYEYAGHEMSVNSVAWAPHDFGLILACGSSDGFVTVLTWKPPNEWTAVKFVAHQAGVNAVNWAPFTTPGALSSSESAAQQPLPRLSTGGCDNLVKVWVFNTAKSDWEVNATLEGHTDWVRDVAWAPNIGLPFSTISSCGQDGQVLMWSQGEQMNSPWQKTPLTREPFKAPVWRVSWSVTGSILAVSSGDNQVTLWKESLDHQWHCLSQLAAAGDSPDSGAPTTSQ
jgi:protein transport protein SEC13